MQQIIKDELVEIRDEFATPRRTEIVDGGAELEDEDLIQREDMVVTVSHAGYIKRVALSEYRAQHRGGKGRSAMSTRDEDFVTKLFVANTHTPILFFSSRGMAYKMKVWRLPLAAPQARGKALVNLLPLEPGERITSILPLPEDAEGSDRIHLMFATTNGTVRRNALSDFVDVRRNGKIAMKLEEGDGIVGVEHCSDADDVLLTTSRGQCIRFSVNDVRVFAGRNSVGVRGISLAPDDHVISMSILRHFDASPTERAAYLRMSRAVRGEAEAEIEEASVDGETEEAADAALSQARYAGMSAAEQFVLTVSERGYGKRTSSFEFRTTNRGGKGIVAMIVNERNGALVASFPVDPSDQIMLVTNGGQTIRTHVEGRTPIRIVGRNSQGVRIFNTAEGEKVVSVEHISDASEAEPEDEQPSTDQQQSDDGSEGPDDGAPGGEPDAG